ncbi:hypothetical protein ACOMHN_023933 [Nucella lapillus]
MVQRGLSTPAGRVEGRNSPRNPEKDVQELQEQDPTLECVRRWLTRPARPNAVAVYVKNDGLLYRRYTKGGNHCRQLVVPKPLRSTVLEMGHDTPMAGHLGTKKTLERIRQDFYWPGVNSDVRRHCRSCDPCQRTTPKGRTTRVPVGTVPLVGEPFAKVGIDLVGPIKPASARGHRYTLVVVDYATRYPEALPLRGIDSETVAEALWQMWTRVGIPKEVLTDMGTQFVSRVMDQVNRLVGIRSQTTTPYPTQAIGLVERFNATLKQMLKRLCQEHPKDWDRFVPAVLFAYREVPQESMRFSPFERYEMREATPVEDQGIAAAGLAPVVVEEQDENTAPDLSPNIPVIPLVTEETWRDVHMGEQLTREQIREARSLCEEFPDVLTDLPLRCEIGQCELKLDTETPIRVKQYPLPHSKE